MSLLNWLLIVVRVTEPPQVRLVKRLGLVRSNKTETTFWSRYPRARRERLLADIEQLRNANLHGRAKLVAAPARKPKLRALPSRDGFGGRLNATPIKGIWRIKKRQTT